MQTKIGKNCIIFGFVHSIFFCSFCTVIYVFGTVRLLLKPHYKLLDEARGLSLQFCFIVSGNDIACVQTLITKRVRVCTQASNEKTHICYKFFVRLHCKYNTSLALWKQHVNLSRNNKFIWCFHKAKLVLHSCFVFETSVIKQLITIIDVNTDTDNLHFFCYSNLYRTSWWKIKLSCNRAVTSGVQVDLIKSLINITRVAFSLGTTTIHTHFIMESAYSIIFTCRQKISSWKSDKADFIIVHFTSYITEHFAFHYTNIGLCRTPI